MALNAAALVALTSGGAQLLDRQVFNSSGTWTKPTDYEGNIASGAGKLAVIYCIGGGASGQTGGASAGYGGGPGGKTVETVGVSLLASTETVTVGAGGAASGNAGGDSSVGSWCRAGGGRVNVSAGSGGPGYGNVPLATAIPAPDGSIQFTAYPGQGSRGGVAGLPSFNAAGGALSTAGSNASGNGCGGGGGGGSGGNVAGGAGGVPGGGGGGGGGGGSSVAGGVGGAGRVIVEVYG